MNEKRPFYITTTIPYVNEKPHVGFALEVVQADVLARYQRLMGREVFYNAGTDEHGQKIWQKAQESGEDTQAYVNRFAESVKKLKEILNLSYDHFIRTTDPDHEQAAQELWKRCEAKGDIYKKKYKGLYCIGCEKFLAERDLVDGKCPLHPKLQPTILEEENYFFKLSNYKSFLKEYLDTPGIITPDYRRTEALSIAEALDDFSISRERQKLPWGVPVPGDDTQVMYVWFDALTNYISTLGWPQDNEGKFKNFWEKGEKIQMAGKDQIRFQSIMWPAILKSADIVPTDKYFYHGFINSGGQRMSKSLGNVISPVDMVERYGIDATRYILLRHVHPTDDTDITWERMDEWYTANLVNGLGNLVARVMKMAEDNLELAVDVSDIKDIPLVKQRLNEYHYNSSADAIWSYITDLDELIQEQKPFQLVKTDAKKAQQQIGYLVKELYRIATELEPFMPKTAHTIQTAIKENKKPENLFARLD
jgi:methionyl-tRNA synthetase